MKAAVFHGPNQPLTIEQVDIDDPQDHEVLVRTAATGVCHSDLHFVEGLYPHPAPAILGHEAAGAGAKGCRPVAYLKAGGHPISDVVLRLRKNNTPLSHGSRSSTHRTR